MRLESVIQRNTRALQPAATTVPIGTLYYVTDEKVLERSNGTIWEEYSGIGEGIRRSIKRKAWLNFPAANQSVVLVGMSPITQSAISDGSDANRVYSKFTTPTLNALMGVVNNGVSAFKLWRAQNGLYFYTNIRTGPSIANIRLFVVLSDISLNMANDSSPSHYIGFRYSTSAADTGWRGVCCNGVAINQTFTADVGAIAIDTMYELEVIMESGVASFYVNGVHIGDISTNLPTDPMGMTVRAQNLLSENKEINLNHIYIECP